LTQQRQTAVPYNPSASITHVNSANSFVISSPSDVIPGPYLDAWIKFVTLAAHDFSEPELVELSWETITDLLKYYKMSNPIEIGKVQLAWKRKSGQLPSDELGALGNNTAVSSPSPVEMSGHNGYYVPAAMMRENPQHVVSCIQARESLVGSKSPRRQGRFVPGYQQPLHFRRDASPRVDTGRSSKSPARTSGRN
jgi:hypothetical protein